MRLIFFGATCLIGVALLVCASLLRWRPGQEGWRAALFSAGFGLSVLGALAPLDGPPWGLAMLVIAASAQVGVGVSALRQRRR